MALGPGGVPTGWFFGLDIPQLTLIAEISFGHPFDGVLPGAGIDAIAFPLPAGLVHSTVGLHSNMGGLEVFRTPAFACVEM